MAGQSARGLGRLRFEARLGARFPRTYAWWINRALRDQPGKHYPDKGVTIYKLRDPLFSNGSRRVAELQDHVTPHFHPPYKGSGVHEIYTFLSGEGVMHIGTLHEGKVTWDSRQKVGPGRSIEIPPGKVHCLYNSHPDKGPLRIAFFTQHGFENVEKTNVDESQLPREPRNPNYKQR